MFAILPAEAEELSVAVNLPRKEKKPALAVWKTEKMAINKAKASKANILPHRFDLLPLGSIGLCV